MNSLEPNLDGRGLAVGIVSSRFNAPIVEKMAAACVAELVKHGVLASQIEHVRVPGALEIPLALQAMALSQRYQALIAIGAVIRGETFHFEVVSMESARAVMDVMLDTGVPIANGILTCDSDEQALARVLEKGSDCAKVAIEMARHLQTLTQHRDAP